MARRKQSRNSRGKFSDGTRAKVFAWDRAICALTGANLWMLDYGLSGLEKEDWADHIRPVARGGEHVAENGVCASAEANFTKSANGRANEYWFIGGRPTYRYFSDQGMVSESVAAWLKRDVRPYDWYFNRSLRNLMLAVVGYGYDASEYARHKNKMYYPRAAFRFLCQFREAWSAWATAHRAYSRDAVERDWQVRGLLPDKPWPEQCRVLELLDMSTPAAIDSLALQISDRYVANFNWIEKMDYWTRSCDPAEGEAILSAMDADEGISPAVKNLVRHNIRLLSGLPMAPSGEAERKTTRRYDEYE